MMSGKKNKNRMFPLALLVCLALVMNLVPAAALAEGGAAVAVGSSTTLSEDITLDSPLPVTADTSIDLAGHTLTINAGSDGSSGAISVTKGAKLSITDSSGGKGSLVLTVGAPVESKLSASAPYQGIAVASGDVLLDGVVATVTYTGSSNTKPATSMRGIALTDGSMSLQDGSTLAVTAAPEDDAYGTEGTTGIWVASACKGTVSIDPTSSVVVRNNASASLRGSCDYPDYDGDTGANSSSNADLVELQVDESSSLYDELQETFLEYAKYDSTNDSVGNVFGAQIYYMNNVKLPCGLRVWAYSDVVSGSNVGKHEYIVAKHVFVRSSYYNALDATGIECESGYAGTLSCEGSIKVVTSNGDAVGVSAPKSVAEKVDSSKLEVSSGSKQYRTLVSNKLDLNDYITIPKFEQSRVVYPSDANYNEVAYATPNAQALVCVDEDATETEKHPITYEQLTKSVYAAMHNDAIKVSYTGLYDASGQAADDVVYTVAYGASIADDAQAPTVNDYTSDGVTYRFVGWRPSGASLTAGYYYPSSAIDAIAVDSNLSGVTSGAVKFQAYYVAVGAGQHLATFNIDGYLCACAVDDGAAATYKACNSGFDSEPDKLDEESGYDYEFKGWAEGADGTSGADSAFIYSKGDAIYDKDLPAASTDVQYYAKFERAVSTNTLALSYWRSGINGYVYSTQSVSGYEWTTPAIEVAQKYINIGDTFTQDGVEYTFLGWSTRLSDVEPLYTDELPLLRDQSWDRNASFFGIYSSNEKTYAVKFYVDGELYAENDAAKATDTLYQAFEDSTNPVQPVPTAQDTAFRGWNTTAGADSILLASVMKVSEAAGDADTLELHAIWRSTLTTVVTFYDSDGKTVIDQLEVDPGSTVEASTGEDPKPTGKNADLFTGWADADGNAFSVSDTIVNESIDVYAQYKKRNKGSGTVRKSTNSVSISKTKGFTAPSAGLKSAEVSALKTANKTKATPAITQASGDGGDGGTNSGGTSGDEQNSYDILGTGDAAFAQSVAALAAVAAVFVALVAGVAVFFRRRCVTDDEELTVAAEVATESIRF